MKRAQAHSQPPGQRRPWLTTALFLIPMFAGCGGRDTLAAGDNLTLSELTWNSRMTNLSPVAGVAEIYDDTLVLSASGAVVLTSGVPLATDTTVTQWSKVAVLPAADQSGDWAVAIDGQGALRRLKNRSVMEDISDRYGLSGVAVTDLAGLGTVGAAFSIGGALAVADGQVVTRMDGGLTMLAGAAGRAAGVLDGKLRLIDTQKQSAQDYDLGQPTGVVFDDSGKLVVATADSLYQESDPGVLHKIHSTPSEPLLGIARSGSSLWLHLGDSLALLQNGQLRRAASGDAAAALAADAQLFGSPSGDVWTLSAGNLRLLAADNGGGADQDLWRRNAQPIFSRLCATCHLPGGSSGINLSTYATWSSQRAYIAQRVLDGKPTPMPPAGAGVLTADERAALQAWTDNTPM